jgi:hypothetical protein
MSDTTKKAYAIMRAQKLKQGRVRGSFAKSWKHLAKHAEACEISHPELSKYNRTLIHKEANRDYKPLIKKMISNHNNASKKRLRSDASIGVEFIFSYSPHLGFNLKFIEQYEKEIQKYLQTHFKDFKLLRLDRHCDESSVHWHAVGVCINKDNKICNKDTLGDRDAFRRHQTAFAEQVAYLGLCRGVPKKETKRRHTTKTEWERQQEIEKEAQKALHDIGLDR